MPHDTLQRTTAHKRASSCESFIYLVWRSIPFVQLCHKSNVGCTIHSITWHGNVNTKRKSTGVRLNFRRTFGECLISSQRQSKSAFCVRPPHSQKKKTFIGFSRLFLITHIKWRERLISVHAYDSTYWKTLWFFRCCVVFFLTDRGNWQLKVINSNAFESRFIHQQ